MKPWEMDWSAPAQPAQPTPKPWEMDWSQAAPQGPEPSFMAKVVGPLAKPFMKSAVGAQQALHGLTGAPPGAREAALQDLATVERANQAAPAAYRIPANLAGGAFQYAAPGMLGAAGLATVFPKWAARRAALAAAAGEAGGIGAFEAGVTPGGASERAMAGLTGAGATLAGHGAGQAITRALRGVKRSPAAAALEAEEGIRTLTPYQAGSPVLGGLEQKLANVPGWGGVQTLRETPLQQWQLNRLREVYPRTLDTGYKGFRQAQQGIGREYDKLWARAPLESISLSGFKQNLLRQVDEATQVFDDIAQQRIRRSLRGQLDRLSKGRKSPEAWQSVYQNIRDQAVKHRKAGEVDEAKVFEGTLEAITDLLPKDFQGQLRDLGRRYRDLQTLQIAAQYQPALEAGSEFTPVDLLKAARRMGSDKMVAAGEAAMQPQAVRALSLTPPVSTRREMLGEQIAPTAVVGAAGYAAGGVPGAAAGMAGGIPLASEPMRRLLMGQTRLQRGLRPSERVAQGLREWGGRTGAALEEEYYE